MANSFHADIVVDDLLYSGQFYPDTTADVVMNLESMNDKFVFVHLSGNEQNSGYWQGGFVPVAAAIAGAAKTAALLPLTRPTALGRALRKRCPFVSAAWPYRVSRSNTAAHRMALQP